MRIATRRSRLARAQTASVMRLLREHTQASLEEVVVETRGDAHPGLLPQQIGADGIFVKELFAALCDGRADLAVHSFKDVPTSVPPDVACGAVPPREDARDALVSRTGYPSLAALPPGARVGTSSLRRAAFVRSVRPDVTIVALRGNVETRLRKVEEGVCDAAILALAGLMRAGLADRLGPAVPLPLDVMVPAAGQGALYVQCRARDAAAVSLVRRIADPASEQATAMERAFLATVGGGCLAPIGVHVTIEEGRWQLVAAVAATDGTRCLRRTASGELTSAAQNLTAVEAIAHEMLASGGRELIASARREGEDNL